MPECTLRFFFPYDICWDSARRHRLSLNKGRQPMALGSDPFADPSCDQPCDLGQPIDTSGTRNVPPSNGSPHTANTWVVAKVHEKAEAKQSGNSFMESSSPLPEGKKKETNSSGVKTEGHTYQGTRVVTVTSGEDVL
ncbi:hypothetical protein AVEN_184959-1 [Araneus ventricosus]|uniref:Uncharacterized protein n=1 Tax=Araneus ventricosus TaxID=182803 RepID=A0A4Y2HEP6_ARAVE|nr:hypothetical protein AVEN_184959-1 [Araneus ventricosus]